MYKDSCPFAKFVDKNFQSTIFNSSEVGFGRIEQKNLASRPNVTANHERAAKTSGKCTGLIS